MSRDQAGDARSKWSVLRKHPIFSDLAPEALDQLCRYAKHTSLKRGATIFSKGDPGDSLFAIISGTVKISISSSEGRNAILNLIGAGEMVGEIAVLAGKGRTADAIANTVAKSSSLTAETFCLSCEANRRVQRAAPVLRGRSRRAAAALRISIVG